MKSAAVKIGWGVMIIMMIWFAFSWVDVLSHNDPFDGDQKYSPCNAFILISNAYKGVTAR